MSITETRTREVAKYAEISTAGQSNQEHNYLPRFPGLAPQDLYQLVKYFLLIIVEEIQGLGDPAPRRLKGRRRQ